MTLREYEFHLNKPIAPEYLCSLLASKLGVQEPKVIYGILGDLPVYHVFRREDYGKAVHLTDETFLFYLGSDEKARGALTQSFTLFFEENQISKNMIDEVKEELSGGNRHE